MAPFPQPQPIASNNRRAEPRFYPPPGLHVKFATDPHSGWQRARLRDVSYRGACLEADFDTRTGLIYGDRIHILLRRERPTFDEAAVEVMGAVMRIESTAEQVVLNLCFVDVGPEQRRLLTDYILRVAELKSPGNDTNASLPLD